MKNIPFLKLVYFDEEAATDLIYMINDGEVVQALSSQKVTSKNGEASGKAEGGFSAGLFSLLGLRMEINGAASVSKGTEHLINRAITNTVLTDYLSAYEKISSIVVFEQVKAQIYPESATFYKMYTPFMVMADGQVSTGQDDMKLDMQKVDYALENGKGYYEVVVESPNEEKCVLRFNLKSFKNSYMLADLQKMYLTYHAVKVGTTTLDDLSMSKEFGFSSESKEIDGTKLANYEGAYSEENLMDVYDVILAGVSNSEDVTNHD